MLARIASLRSAKIHRRWKIGPDQFFILVLRINQPMCVVLPRRRLVSPGVKKF